MLTKQTVSKLPWIENSDDHSSPLINVYRLNDESIKLKIVGAGKSIMKCSLQLHP